MGVILIGDAQSQKILTKESHSIIHNIIVLVISRNLKVDSHCKTLIKFLRTTNQISIGRSVVIEPKTRVSSLPN